MTIYIYTHIYKCTYINIYGQGFPGASVGKKSVCNAGNPGLIPGLGRSYGEEIDYPLQYCCLKNPMNRGAWWATAQQDHKEYDTTEMT